MSVSPVLQFGAVPWGLLQRLFVVGALLGGAALALSLDDGRYRDRLRERFVLGVPWGTLVTLLGVLAVYLFVQGGYAHWRNPVVIPFRAWSYFEPLGMLVAGFAHAGPGHLLGNLFGALTLAPMVEYAVGHYPPEESRTDGSGNAGRSGRLTAVRARLDALRREPLARAFLLFPLAVAVVGVVLTLFTIGAVIGFSGVVFAFAGFALVRYPLATVLALVASDLLNLLYNALQHPTITASGRSRFVTPWFADIAIQGHAIGLLVGVVLGALLLAHRVEDPPSPTRLFSGALLLASVQSLWAVYWYRGGTEYVLYRAAGLGIVALAAVLIVVAVAGPEHRPFGVIDDEPSQGVATDGGDDSRLRDLSIRQIGMATVVVVAALLSGPAVAVNLVSAEGDLPGDPATVRDYEITYAEGVENEMVSAIPVSLFGETTQVVTSGVIVSNPEREIWQSVVPQGRLAANGRATVVVGGVGWRETVTVVRRGWRAVGGGTAYAVALDDDGERRTVYTSGLAKAEPRIAGQNVSVVARDDTFLLLVTEENDTVHTTLPAVNESVTVRNVTFEKHENRVVAVHEGTRVTVLKAETYD